MPGPIKLPLLHDLARLNRIRPEQREMARPLRAL